MLEIGREPFVRVAPAPRALVSWSTAAPAGALELVVHTLDGRVSKPLPYVAFEAGARASLDGFDPVARIATDVVSAASEIVAVDVRANVSLDRVAVSVPVHGPQTARPAFAGELDVPMCSQYVPDHPSERGWCAPAAMAMLAGTFGATPRVADVADAVYDSAYRGTGNWAFATAYAAQHGHFGAAAFLRDLQSLDALLAAGFPAAASIAWEAGTLPGAPLERSAGHLVVVRGRAPNGDAIVNDPAQPLVRHVYPGDAFERAWLGHGGVALLVAPFARIDALVEAANA